MFTTERSIVVLLPRRTVFRQRTATSYSLDAGAKTNCPASSATQRRPPSSFPFVFKHAYKGASFKRGNLMAVKKRRGRPPGSKNKPKVVGSVGTMDVVQLSSHIESLRKMLAAKIEQQRAFFERQLAGLGGYSNS